LTRGEVRKRFDADRRGEATCPLCGELRLYINGGKNGSVLVHCMNCGKAATAAILACKKLTFVDLYEDNDPRFQRVKKTP
jgi:uncharacterized Zn finger protein